ncbi:MAG: phosphoglycerate kinase, partial [Parachlamydiaceae bacterium]|nr:phosphoglycerate kinase [Parachlamydiaceae bacterium]
MTRKLFIKDLFLKDKKVLVRVDFNVPLNKDGHITDDSRIIATLPSIRYILEQGGVPVLMSHLGRPSGKRVAEMSLKPCADHLGKLLSREVRMAPDCVGLEVKKMVSEAKCGQIIMLENLRFHPAEEHPEKDQNFAKQLAALGDVYVNDAFGAAHRAHASISEVPRLFPRQAAAGFLMEKEIKFLGETLINPKRPFFAILGGAKLSSKLGVVEALLLKADALFIGGGMAFTFFKAQGIPIGDSIHEDEFLEKAKELLVEANKDAIRLFLPLDWIVADSISPEAETKLVKSSAGIPPGFEGVDIGPETIKIFSQELQKAATILWNGPLGVFEIPAFAKGTQAIARVLADVEAITIVGGGDSIAAVQAAG